MSRVKRGVTGHAKHKKVYKAAKGYYGRRKNTIRIAKQAVEKAGQYAFRDRKRKKRTFRALWIQRLNAAVRPFELTYSRFIDGLSKSGITVDRKVLSDLAIHEPAAFQRPIISAAFLLPAAHEPRAASITVLMLDPRRSRGDNHAQFRGEIAVSDLTSLETSILEQITAAGDEAALEAV